MLELCILGLLKERPMHGYDLRKRLRDDFGPMSNLSFGSLYPALARLETSGSIRSTQAQPGRARVAAEEEPPLAMTGSLTGERAALMARRATAKAAAALGTRSTRMRKVYEITPEGELLFDRLLEEPDGRAAEASSFGLRLAFASHLAPQGRIRLLERRRLQLLDRLADSERSLARRGQLDRYERAIAEHALETLESDLAWVERLLATERDELDRAAAVTAGSATSVPPPAPKGATATTSPSPAPSGGPSL